jgi:hypothetical protein
VADNWKGKGKRLPELGHIEAWTQMMITLLNHHQIQAVEQTALVFCSIGEIPAMGRISASAIVQTRTIGRGLIPSRACA